jgi:Domain of unknown function (DUF4845)
MRCRRSADRERGTTRVKMLMWVAIFAFCMYVGIMVVPVLLAEYEFQDAMTTTARIGAASRLSPDQIRKTLADEAISDDVPVRPEDIHVESQGGHVQVSASYSVTVNLQVYEWTLTFNPSATAAAI